MAGEILSIFLDISEIIKMHKDLAPQLIKKTNEAVEKLSYQAHTFMVEEAQSKLHSSREIYLQNLNSPKKVEGIDSNIWEITLNEEANWIEDGIKSGFDMLPGLLGSSKAKTGKNGKYLVVPFKHSKKPSSQTQFQQSLAKQIKTELKKRGISQTKIEKNPDGSPKLGLLHKFDVKGPEISQKQSKPWQVGPGPIKPQDRDMEHFLNKVRVYQRETKGASGESQIKRDIMTFRTASEKHKGQKWIHPGIEPQKIFDKAKDFVEKEWESTILPEILRDLGI